VERTDNLDAVRDHLRGLQAGRSLGDAQKTRRAAGNRGGKRHRRVDQDLSRLQHALQVREVLRLVAEGHAQEDDRPLLGGVAVFEAAHVGIRHLLLQARRRLRRTARIAGADHDRCTDSSEAQTDAEPEGSGTADDGYWLCRHGGRIYPSVRSLLLTTSYAVSIRYRVDPVNGELSVG
jgi:hypothetical protein